MSRYFITLVWFSGDIVSFSYMIHRSLDLNRKNGIIKLSTNNIDDLTPILVRNLQSWGQQQTLSSIIAKNEVYDIVNELYSNREALDRYDITLDNFLRRIDELVREENRKVKDLIGMDTTNKILATIEDYSVYDASTVQAFLRTPAIEKMIGGILYEATFEFIQRFDIIGNIVNSLPIIGPIRQQIMKEFKKSVDKTLGAQVKTFLSTFNRVAVQRMVEFILSPENTKLFAVANRNLVDSLLSRPVSSYLPDLNTSVDMRKKIIIAIRDIPIAEVIDVVDKFYQLAEGKRVVDVVDLDKIFCELPIVKSTAEMIVKKFLASPEGQSVISAL